MNKTDFMEGIHILQNAYNQKFSADKLRVYYEALKDMKKEQYINNIKQQIKLNTFMPNVAQIKNEKQKLSGFEPRDYSNFDFSTLYANKGRINKEC